MASVNGVHILHELIKMFSLHFRRISKFSKDHFFNMVHNQFCARNERISDYFLLVYTQYFLNIISKLIAIAKINFYFQEIEYSRWKWKQADYSHLSRFTLFNQFIGAITFILWQIMILRIYFFSSKPFL